jgi:hypothetical protein
VSVIERRFEMRRFFEIAFIQFLVARLTSIRSDVFGRTCWLGIGAFLLLASTDVAMKQHQKKNSLSNQREELCSHSSWVHAVLPLIEQP